MLDGEVEAIAEVGNTMVIGGNFSQIATAADRNTAIDRPYLFSFQKGSGQINTNFSPDVNGEITALLPTGDGQTVWIAGGFNTLNGETVRNLAKVDLATGLRVTQFDPPALNGRVHDLQLRNGKLYLTGRFTMAGGEPRTLLAAVDPTTGALDPEVRADFTEPRRDSFLTINSSDVSPDGTRMVVTGNFTKINGQDRYQIALLDLTTSPVSVADWQTGLYGDGCANAFKTYMRDVDFSPDGTSFAVVTTGAYNTTFLCDTAAAWDATATGTNLQPEWVNYSGGDTLTAVAWTDTAIYIGGHQRWANNPYAADRVGAGAVPREGLAALDPRSGATLTWNPGRTRGVAVYSLVATDAGLWIGSDTDRIAGFQYRGRLAFMPTDSSTTMPTEFTGILPGQVVSLGLMQGFFGSVLDRTTTRTFTGTEVTGTPVTAEGTEDWSSLRGSFMIDGKLYTGWSDSTFRVQDYDGTTFGPQSTIPLALVHGDSLSLNRFATEDLSSITGMFYDAGTGRLYFTKSGSNSLHYRSFSPESRIVGGQRISSTSGAGGVDWSSVQTMFMADGRLYTSSTNGNLVSRELELRRPACPSPEPRPRSAAPASTGRTGGPVTPSSWPPRACCHRTPCRWPSSASSCTEATCQLDASASSDADGTIESYLWDFGDGTSPGAGVLANHTYAASGTYTVTLTVTDDRGDTATFSQDVTVTVPNQLPVAAFSANCAGLDCTFDSSNSSRPRRHHRVLPVGLRRRLELDRCLAEPHLRRGRQLHGHADRHRRPRRTPPPAPPGCRSSIRSRRPSVVFRAAAGTNSNSDLVHPRDPRRRAPGRRHGAVRHVQLGRGDHHRSGRMDAARRSGQHDHLVPDVRLDQDRHGCRRRVRRDRVHLGLHQDGAPAHRLRRRRRCQRTPGLARHHLDEPADDPDGSRRGSRQRRGVVLGRQVQRQHRLVSPGRGHRTRHERGRRRRAHRRRTRRHRPGRCRYRRRSHRQLRIRQPTRHGLVGRRGTRDGGAQQRHRSPPSPPTAPHCPARWTPRRRPMPMVRSCPTTGPSATAPLLQVRLRRRSTREPAPTW